MKCYKRFVLLLSFLAFLVLPILQPLNSYASETTSSGSEDLFEYTETYVRNNFNALCRYVVKQNAIISDAIIGTWDNFVSWLNSSGNGDVWEQHPHSPIRTQNGVQNVEVPDEVLNVLNQYVIYQIQNTPTQYKECYISSYNFLNTSQFNNYNGFKSVQELIKNNNGYTFFISPNGMGTGTQNNTYIVTVDVSKYPVNFIGTELSGIFNTNVTLEHNWSTISTLPQNTDGVDIYMYRNSTGYLGAKAKTYQAAASNAGYSSTYMPSNATNLLNTNSMFTSNRVNVFSNKSSNELIYLFPTINAYKNYNSGQPQPYYLTSDGLSTNMSNWSVGSGTINTGTLSNANSTYNSVINNIQSGWTAQEVLELVDKIMSQNGGSGSNGSDNSSDNPFEFLGKIGEVIGNLVNGIGNLIVNILDGISKAFIGEDGNGGIIGLVSNILTSLTTLISEDFANFINGIFSFMPSELRTVLIAGFTISVFLGVLKMIRK